MPVHERDSNRFRNILVAFGLAVLLWLLVLMERPARVDLVIPLRIEPPQGMVVAANVPKELNLVASGPRGSLAFAGSRIPDAVVRASASGGGPVVVETAKLLLLPENVKLVSVEPATVTVFLGRVGGNPNQQMEGTR